MKNSYSLFVLAALFFACTPQAENNVRPDDPSKDVTESTDPGSRADPSADQPGSQDPGEADFTPEEWYKTPFWSRTDRQIMGLRGPVKTYRVGEDGPLYHFDEQGHITAMENGDYAWTLTYDDQGRRIHTECRIPSEDNYLTTVIDYTYGNGTKFVARDRDCQANYLDASDLGDGVDREELYISIGLSRKAEGWLQPDYDTWRVTEYTFGADGNLTITFRNYATLHGEGPDAEVINDYVSDIDIVEYSGGWPVKGKNITSMTWRANGMPEKCEMTTVDDTYGSQFGDIVETWKWHESDRILVLDEYVHVNGYGGAFGGDYGRKYKYNEHDDLIQLDHAHFENKQWFVNYYTDYVYDAHGNWISRMEDIEPYLAGDRSTSEAIRVITYY